MRAGLSAVVTRVGRPSGVASGAGAVWVTDRADDQLLRVDPAEQVDDRIPVGREPAGWRPASGYDNLERTVTAVPNRDGTWNVTVASNGSYAAFASPIDGGPVIAQLAQ